MNVKCYGFHKSGTMFLYRLFLKIAQDNNIDYYSINNEPMNDSLWNADMDNCIICPIREFPDNYNEKLKYIIHLRNPLDTLISEYYSYGFTHIDDGERGRVGRKQDNFEEYVNDIVSRSIDEYCLWQLEWITGRYDKMLDWIEKYKDKENVFVSNYDDMYYDFPNWLKNVYDFLSLEGYDETLSMFEKEFSNSDEEYTKTDIKNLKKSHHRSGLSKQYLIELKKSTIELIISRFPDNINKFFDFA